MERTEDVIRMDAAFHAIICEIDAVKTRVQGFIAANKQREVSGALMAYSDYDFLAAERELLDLARALRTRI